jgi:hypothetical protein
MARAGSADAWIDHVCPNGEWRLMTAKDICKKIAREAKALGVKAPSYSAVAAALLKRPRTDPFSVPGIDGGQY